MQAVSTCISPLPLYITSRLHFLVTEVKYNHVIFCYKFEERVDKLPLECYVCLPSKTITPNTELF